MITMNERLSYLSISALSMAMPAAVMMNHGCLALGRKTG